MTGPAASPPAIAPAEMRRLLEKLVMSYAPAVDAGDLRAVHRMNAATARALRVAHDRTYWHANPCGSVRAWRPH